jgi:L-threonylcarbamoyladenylate synthase
MSQAGISYLTAATSRTVETNTQVIADGEEAGLRAGDVIRCGGLLAFRTDTLYGIGADPFNPEAVRRIDELKGREGKPILVLVSDRAWAERLTRSRGAFFDVLSERFWPGPLTLVLAADPRLPTQLTAGTGTIGVRYAKDERLCSFVEACGGVLTATSANRAGHPPARSAREVLRAFPVGLDLIVDGGETAAEKPSSVVDISGSRAKLIREGALPWHEIQQALANAGGHPAG